MSSLNLIMDALMADIPPNVQQDWGDEIWDAHHKFQSSLLEALAGHPDAEDMVNRYREEPDVYGAVLEEALINAGVTENAYVAQAAGEVMALVDPLDAATDSADVANVPGTYGTGDVSTDHV